MTRPYTVSKKVIEANRKKAHLGGQATLKKYGREFYSRIGKLGWKALNDRYYWSPYGTSDWAIVNRETGRIVALKFGKLPEERSNGNGSQPA